MTTSISQTLYGGTPIYNEGHRYSVAKNALKRIPYIEVLFHTFYYMSEYVFSYTRVITVNKLTDNFTQRRIPT